MNSAKPLSTYSADGGIKKSLIFSLSQNSREPSWLYRESWVVPVNSLQGK